MREFSRSVHGGAAKVRMQVAQMQDGEAIESAWQIWETYNVAPNLHLACVSPASPIGPRHAKRYLDHRLHQRQVLEVQEAEPLAKSLRLVLALCRDGAAHATARAEFRGGAALRRDRVGGASSRSRLPPVGVQSRLCRRRLCTCRPLGKGHDGIVTLPHEERDRTIRGTDFHAAATTSRHVVIAAARSTRCD
jgi:hypothetical protein